MESLMRFGISLPPFADYANPRYLAKIAKEAEDAGWDGFFVWDHIFFDPTFNPIPDMWIALAAVAMSTERLRLGAMVTPVARRRPWKLARETVTLDHLSNGRLVVGVGLGGGEQWDFGFFHEPTDAKVRAQLLDEGLDILAGLWSGELFQYHGQHYQVEPVKFLPRPQQSPRIPIWVGGQMPKKAPMRRAARWDGYFPLKWETDPMSPQEWREAMAYIAEHRSSDAPFEQIHGGRMSSDELAHAADIVGPLAEAGVTWWIEDVSPGRYGFSYEEQWAAEATRQMDERIRQGPPKL
jgi:alkanesulfonate monooxygenase SsuD/methylene tetrahydromethanopterin reductase-like flavin-dependent oxidoreductase (luciferase family)